MPKLLIDLTGQKFGRLTIVKEVLPRSRRRRWHYLCDCGVEGIIVMDKLRSGHTKSWGCYRSAHTITAKTTHGLSGSKEYRSWRNIKERCTNPNNKRWERYGGRGIKISERWANSFENFLADMGQMPSPQHSIDRIDNNGDYTPENCRWATPKEQANNRGSNVQIVYQGVSYPSLKLLAGALGLNYDSLRKNYKKTSNIGEAVEKSVKV